MSQTNLDKYFWDVNPQEIDYEKNASFVIERILNFGDVKVIKWLRKKYSDDQILEVVQNSRNLNKKTHNFWQIIFQEK